ncbi:MAG: sigma-70 family RNA polymerase sigma factor [Gemmatimonadales bacterium]
MTAIIAHELWQQYRGSGDPDARSQLLERYLGLVHHVARQIAPRVGDRVEIDELVSAGTMGLMQSLEGFDLSRGLAFSTYAMRRIRGAILDDLRNKDWVPRSVRSKGRKLAGATRELEGLLGRTPRPAEVAGHLSLELETYWDWRREVDGATLVSFDGPAAADRDTSATLEETLGDTVLPPPGEGLDREEDAQGLRSALAALPPKERTVLSLYYYEELNLRQIAEVLKVTESRVSQIRTRALRRLKERFSPTPAAA